MRGWRYISRNNNLILMTLEHMLDINQMVKLIEGQGQKIKGKDKIGSFVKIIWLYIMNKWLNSDDTYTNDWYQKGIKVDLRSRTRD